MKEQERTVYRCDYCKKHYLQKHACAKHEKYCSRNPENHHACLDCIFLEVDRSQNDAGFNEKTFYCQKLQIELHSSKAEKINHSCLGHTERMPLTCEHHKNHVDQFFDKHPEYITNDPTT